MSKSSTVVRASYPSHEEARQMKERLTDHGFARNSIEISRQPGGRGCDLAVHTSERNVTEVERLLHASGAAYALREVSTGALRAVTTNPMVIGGGIALAGLVAYALLPRNRRATLQAIRTLPRTVSRLPDTVADAASALSERVADVPRSFGARQGSEADRHQRT